MSGPFGSSQFMYATGAAEEGQSLRFEDGDSAYLSWTPASAGNRKTWTWSGWVKRGNLGASQTIFSSGTASPNYSALRFLSSDVFQFFVGGAVSYSVATTAVFRDVSAWYHINFAFDVTEATASNRCKLYVNGVQQTLTGTYPTNADWEINNTYTHSIGSMSVNSTFLNPIDGYLANVCFIDGTALDPTSFGEYQDTLWKPKSDADIQSLTFGTNGFYLPFKQTTEAEGFSTVTYTGNGGTQAIEGVGFEPDLVWFKKRASGTNRDHMLFDTVRGVGNRLRASQTTSESFASDELQSFDSNGFTVGSSDSENGSGNQYVAWCWDAGTGSAASNTDGSITSTVKANTAKGFSIVSYTGNNTSGATVGHGLGVEPELIIVKNRDTATNWAVWNTSLSSGQVLTLNTTNSASTPATAYWDDANNTSSVFALGTNNETNDTDNYIGYCFHSVSGYSSIGSYTGTGASGSSGPTINCGFRPAFVLIKCTSAGSTNWAMLDNTRSVDNSDIDDQLFANLSNSEYVGYNFGEFTSTGFQITDNSSGLQGNYNTSGATYIYIAFADTRDATFFGDTSGNGNNWTPNALNNTDVVPDSPVTGGNFATLNELSNSDSVSLKEGSLEFTADTASRNVQGTMAVSSGKWYFEARMLSGGSAANGYNVGVATVGCANITTNPSAASGGIPSGEALNSVDSRQYFYSNDGGTNTITSNSTAFVSGDIIGVALDLDSATQTVAFYKNGTIIGSAQTLAHQGDTWLPHLYSASTTNTPRIMNFGQDSSFAGNETPQGNTDDNGVGDFYYAPPSGFLCLKTSSLPAATITAPDEYFNTVLYTGNNADRNIDVGFQSDFVWIKERNGTPAHRLYDIVRGDGQTLFSNLTNAEYDGASDGIDFSYSNGFAIDVGSNVGSYNGTSDTYVAWNWKAGGTGVSNTDGSITSTVSANTDAGFSVVSWTDDASTSSTVGHGLNSAPELIITKNRDGAFNWFTWTTVIDGSYDYFSLNRTDAKVDDSTRALPTSSVFTNVGSTSGNKQIAYCFHSVEGYSKIGSYTGNGSTDGTFVHCGFRPAWVIVKKTDSVGHWNIIDIARDTYNVADAPIIANLSNAESTYTFMDVLSNGFKLRNTGGGLNASGGSYIFLAFAEAPFKSANAR